MTDAYKRAVTLLYWTSLNAPDLLDWAHERLAERNEDSDYDEVLEAMELRRIQMETEQGNTTWH